MRKRLVVFAATLLCAFAATASSVSVAMERGEQLTNGPDWVAHILVNTGPFNFDNCTGSLISETFVLTAAHCVTTTDVPDSGEKYYLPNAPSAFQEENWTITDIAARRVVLGRSDLDATSEGVEVGVRAIFVHPDYVSIARFKTKGNGDVKQTRCSDINIFERGNNCVIVDGHFSGGHDLALIELEESVEYEPVSLAREGDTSFGEITAYGFGRVAGGEDDRLLSRGSFLYTAVLACEFPSGFCIQPNGKNRITFGDSGGPWTQTVDDVETVVGVTSGTNDKTGIAFGSSVEESYQWIALTANLLRRSGPILIYGDRTAASSWVAESLSESGWEVELMGGLPDDLSSYGAIFHFGLNPHSSDDASALIDFVKDGGNLYLTGERPCCDSLNDSVGGIVNELVTESDVQIGRLGDRAFVTAPQPVNPSVLGNLATSPNILATFQPSAPGGLAGLEDSRNLLASVDGTVETAIAAAWDSADLPFGSGRLVVVMDVNWPEAQYRDDTTAEAFLENLATFLAGEPGDSEPLIQPLAAEVQAQPRLTTDPTAAHP